MKKNKSVKTVDTKVATQSNWEKGPDWLAGRSTQTLTGLASWTQHTNTHLFFHRPLNLHHALRPPIYLCVMEYEGILYLQIPVLLNLSRLNWLITTKKHSPVQNKRDTFSALLVLGPAPTRWLCWGFLCSDCIRSIRCRVTSSLEEKEIWCKRMKKQVTTDMLLSLMSFSHTRFHSALYPRQRQA